MTTIKAVPESFMIDHIDHDHPQVELAEHFDLPELSDTMEEAEARAKASIFLHVLGHVGKEAAANETEYRNLISYITEQHRDRQRTLERQQDWLTETIKGLFGFMDTGKKKSLNLLGGTVGMRSRRDELTVEDDAAVIEWAEAGFAPDVVRIKKEVNRTMLREYASDLSIVDAPPGVSLTERPDVFYAKPRTK